MVTASRMQNIVQVRKKYTYFVTSKFLTFFLFYTFSALSVESPRGGAIKAGRGINKYPQSEFLENQKIEMDVFCTFLANQRHVTLVKPCRAYFFTSGINFGVQKMPGEARGGQNTRANLFL